MEILGDKAKIGSACLVYTYSRSAHIQAYSWKDLLVLPMIDLSGPATPTNTPFSRRQGHNDGGGDGNEYTCDLDISIHSGSSLCLPFTWYTFYLFRKIYVNSIYIWYLIKHEMFFLNTKSRLRKLQNRQHFNKWTGFICFNFFSVLVALKP